MAISLTLPERPQEPSASRSWPVKSDIRALLIATDPLRRGFLIFASWG